ncbi:hypothetical protein O181_004728 [Austropuccinia psidii MF-1]|uniref:Reverse transcriptase Ty1/copia-type domain-containing protein n=1 Tax=Austropuccinia psidii MF-1 TaxID=1389203 RepID=A0A9Q3BH68_9BASI|nr:hypothetical protein [Austropuccinia psidii MF-1]
MGIRREKETCMEIEQFKARYIAQGFTQQPGIDCFDLYETMASIKSLHLILALKVKFNLYLESFNVRLAYLYSPIHEEVHVQAPVEIRKEVSGKVIKLKKALYGTGQAARCWWLHSQKIMEALGFNSDELDRSFSINLLQE